MLHCKVFISFHVICTFSRQANIINVRGVTCESSVESRSFSMWQAQTTHDLAKNKLQLAFAIDWIQTLGISTQLRSLDGVEMGAFPSSFEYAIDNVFRWRAESCIFWEILVFKKRACASCVSYLILWCSEWRARRKWTYVSELRCIAFSICNR